MRGGGTQNQRYGLEDHLASTWMSKYLTKEDMEKLYSKYSNSKKTKRKGATFQVESSERASSVNHQGNKTTRPEVTHRPKEGTITVNLTSRLHELAAAQSGRKTPAKARSKQEGAKARPTRIPSLNTATAKSTNKNLHHFDHKKLEIVKSIESTRPCEIGTQIRGEASENRTATLATSTQTFEDRSFTSFGVQTSPRTLRSPTRQGSPRSGGPYHSPLPKVVDVVAKASVPGSPRPIGPTGSPKLRSSAARKPRKGPLFSRSKTGMVNVESVSSSLTATSDRQVFDRAPEIIGGGCERVEAWSPLSPLLLGTRAMLSGFAQDIVVISIFLFIFSGLDPNRVRVVPS